MRFAQKKIEKRKTVAILANGNENRNITMHIAVFCGSSLPRNKEIVEAAASLHEGKKWTEIINLDRQ